MNIASERESGEKSYEKKRAKGTTEIERGNEMKWKVICRLPEWQQWNFRENFIQIFVGCVNRVIGKQIFQQI